MDHTKITAKGGLSPGTGVGPRFFLERVNCRGSEVGSRERNAKTFAYFLALLNYSKRAHKSRAKRALKIKESAAGGGQKPTGPKGPSNRW